MTWDTDPNYSFGWWIPFMALFLFAERWPTRPVREANAQRIRFASLLIIWGLLFFAFRLVAETDPDWRPGLWMMVGLYVTAFLGWLGIYGGIAWARHFAFPVCFLFLSLPWFYGIEHPLTQSLMRWNAVLVAGSLRMLAISAEPLGNIIQLPNGQLGVEEACSGILSLQASLMIGCLLGEVYRLTFPRRIVLVLSSMTFALIGNYLRTFFLAMVAFYRDVDAVASWHDTAGYSILIFTGISSWLAALFLETRSVSAPGIALHKTRSPGDEIPRTRIALRVALAIFMATLLAEVGTQVWYGWRESSLIRHPEWAIKFPESATFKKMTLSGVTRQALRCDSVQGGKWQDGQGWNWTAFWIQYKPKPYNRIVLGWHTPDNCLPTVGLTKDQDYPNFRADVNGLHFSVQPRKFLTQDSAIYVFWVVYPNSGDPPPDTDTRISPPFFSKFRIHLLDIWHGYRGVGVETLEVALVGPSSYEAAKAGYLDVLKAIAVPGTSDEALASGLSH